MPGITLFSKTKELEAQTDEFCDKVSEGALAFKLGMRRYLEGDTAGFEEKLHDYSISDFHGAKADPGI